MRFTGRLSRKTGRLADARLLERSRVHGGHRAGGRGGRRRAEASLEGESGGDKGQHAVGESDVVGLSRLVGVADRNLVRNLLLQGLLLPYFVQIVLALEIQRDGSKRILSTRARISTCISRPNILKSRALDFGRQNGHLHDAVCRSARESACTGSRGAHGMAA